MHGALSNGLSPLATRGRHIVSTTGAPLRLCGVNRSGLEYVEPHASPADVHGGAPIAAVSAADTDTRLGSDAMPASAPVSAGGRAFLDAAGITEDEIATIVRRWGARILRLTFNQDFVLRGRRTRSGADYLDALDGAIAWAARHGCYTLLDLQWLDADRVFGMNADFSFNRVAPLPDAGSIEVWRILADRYRDEPAVLFDLFNEPHDPLPDDDHPLLGVCADRPRPARSVAARALADRAVADRTMADRAPADRAAADRVLLDRALADGILTPLPGRRVRMREWQPWAHLLIETIREVHPSALIFVSGVRWAYDLRGMPLIDPAGAPLPNIVYSTHVYPWTRTGLLRFGSIEDDWDRAFGHLAERVPVFVGEWGGTDEHLDWGIRLRRYLDARQIGWTAWSWADWPCLVASCRTRDYSATAFGALVFDALQQRA